jgi:uncharacterized protein involved in type VI secretion and phage assembly
MNEMMLHDVLDHVRNRFYGKYRGTVTAVDAATMRLKANVPAVLPGAPTGWCTPCVPYAGPQVGFLMLPEIGSGVWIEFEGGDLSLPIWVGGYWRDGEYPSDAAADVKVLVTKAPHELKLDDGQGSITLTDPNGNTVTLDDSGLTLANGGSQLAITSSSISVNNGALEVQS